MKLGVTTFEQDLKRIAVGLGGLSVPPGSHSHSQYVLQVDFDAHVADPDAHHNQQHNVVGGDHTVTGAAFDLVGLTGASSLGILTPSADPGAAESILKSTAAGGLTLQSLTAEGNVDVVGGDLTVGSNVLFVDESGARVGINTNPDPQFQLDIAGNIRWSGWGVGKMAIQLDGALMICHYDGPEPYETDYTGVAIGHRGQAGNWNGGVIFRPGKFGTKAVQFNRNRTNLVTNPSFETNLTGWTNAGADGGYASFSRQQNQVYIGEWALGTTAPASPAGQNFAAHSISVNAITTYTVSCYVRAGSNNWTLTTVQTGGTTTTTHTPITGTGDWQRVDQTITTVTGTTTLEIRLRHDGTGGGENAQWDAVQCEPGVLTSYLDGSLDVAHPDGTTGNHSWAATAHNSTSTRTAAHLTYPTSGNIKPGVGTVMAWVYSEAATAENQVIMTISGTSAGNITLRLNTSSQPNALWGTSGINSGTAVTAREWTHLAMTYDGATLRLYVNGSEAASGAVSGFDGMPASMFVGRAATAASWFNGRIDELIIADRAVDADEIRSIYESDAPVFAETSTFHWQAPGPAAIWVDEEGFYGRGSSGASVIGLSTVDGKSWGGVTLNEGDFLLGNSSDGYLQWDIDGGAAGGLLTIKGTVDQLDIANGDVILDGDGITIEVLESTPVFGTSKSIDFDFSDDTLHSSILAYNDTQTQSERVIEVKLNVGGRFGLRYGLLGTNPVTFQAEEIVNAWFDGSVFMPSIGLGQTSHPIDDTVPDSVIQFDVRGTHPTSVPSGVAWLYAFDTGTIHQLRVAFANGTNKIIADDQ